MLQKSTIFVCLTLRAQLPHILLGYISQQTSSGLDHSTIQIDTWHWLNLDKKAMCGIVRLKFVWHMSWETNNHVTWSCVFSTSKCIQNFILILTIWIFKTLKRLCLPDGKLYRMAWKIKYNKHFATKKSYNPPNLHVPPFPEGC